jgi:hypothetical protein
MANPHNRKPVYFRSSNPGLGNVDEIASKVFQFDESGSKPAEVLTGAAVMPPIQALNEIMVWSDSNTLGYAGIADAPMFWGDGGAQDNDKILQMINHVAGRKSGLQFYDLSLATDWILSQDDIYTNLSASGTTGGAYGTADITVEVRSSLDKISLKSMYTNQGKPEAMLYGIHGSVNPMNNPVAWMPMTNGDSHTINNVDIINVGGQIRIDLQFNFDVTHNGYQNPAKYITYYRNGILMNQPPFYTSTSIGFYVYPPGGVQNGDDIKIIISDVAGHAPYTATTSSGSGTSSKILYVDSANTVSAENVKWIQNPATNTPNSGGSYSIHTNVLSGNSANLSQLSIITPPMYGSGNAAEWRTFMQALPGKTVRIYNTFNSTTQWADVQINSIINDESDSAIYSPASISYNVTLVNDNGWDQLAVYDASYIRVEFYN